MIISYTAVDSMTVMKLDFGLGIGGPRLFLLQTSKSHES